MGVEAPKGVTEAYYFAYPIGLLVSFGVYWLACVVSPPAMRFPLSEWGEPKDYIRPEEHGTVIEGTEGDVESENGSASAKERNWEGGER